MSGVVSPVETRSSAVVTPSVPIEAAWNPAIRHNCRTISTVEVLPLVPVTATATSGKGAKNCAASWAKRRRGLASAMWRAPTTSASGRATTAIAPPATAAAI
ncbi:hypothetical protein D9M73_104290 [compost metagenome]